MPSFLLKATNLGQINTIIPNKSTYYSVKVTILGEHFPILVALS